MLQPGPAKKVTIYVSEDQQYRGRTAYTALLEFLLHQGVAGATVTRGIAGFGANHHLHTTRILDLSQHLPVKVEFIESERRVGELLPKLSEMAGSGLIEAHDTVVVKPAIPEQK